MMNNFNGLLSLVDQYLEGQATMSKKEIKWQIQTGYAEENIAGSQFDFLMGLID